MRFRSTTACWKYSRTTRASSSPSGTAPGSATRCCSLTATRSSTGAFVESGKLIGISSYYPQRPLPRNDDHLALVEQHVAALLDELEPPFEWPATASEQMRVNAMRARRDGDEAPTKGPLQDEVHFTADFAATRLGMVLLEGGPPHFMGAAPCCFAAGRIDGVALEAQQDEHAASEEPT
ncbi:MAG: hypothetical protein F4137_14035 [Acidobacteria bacterium]|nr:hypothetical protein [Acidobacteriota bacterium]